MLQFGIGAAELAAANRQTTKKVALISLAAWVLGSALLVGLSILMKHSRRFATSCIHSTPDASRRMIAGQLSLFPDDLRFRVGDVSVCLTPKQASLLEMLIS